MSIDHVKEGKNGIINSSAGLIGKRKWVEKLLGDAENMTSFSRHFITKDVKATSDPLLGQVRFMFSSMAPCSQSWAGLWVLGTPGLAATCNTQQLAPMNIPAEAPQPMGNPNRGLFIKSISWMFVVPVDHKGTNS